MNWRTHNKNWITFCLMILFAVAIYLLVISKPSADKKFKTPPPRINVESVTLVAETISPRIRSYGRVQPRVLSTVIAQVSGRVEFISEDFRDGGFFSQGDVLLKIESVDYQNNLAIERANVADAKRRLAEEQALSMQAEKDWQRLGDGEAPNSLTLRSPQLEAAKAQVESAQARSNIALLNLKRTEIRAPFDGRVLTTTVDLGQVVANNSQLGQIFSSDAIEVRLPIKNDELPFLQLPETYRRKKLADDQQPTVDIISELGKKERWRGKIVRTSGSIDEFSRQLYVVARIDDPFGEKAEGRFPLKIGQYVSAEIKAKPIQNALSIPSQSVYQGSYVYVVRDGAIYRKNIQIAWQDGDKVILKSGLNSGDVLVTSPLGQVASGTKVELKGQPKTSARKKWYERLPADELEKLKKRAEAQGKTIEQMQRQMRTQRKRNGEVTE